jgi:hypothetical protein
MARSGQNSLTLGLPRVYPGLVENKRLALKLKGLNAHAIRFKGSEPIIAVSHGPFSFRANSGGENYPG